MKVRALIACAALGFALGSCGPSKTQSAGPSERKSNSESQAGKVLGDYELTFYWLAEPAATPPKRRRKRLVDKSCKTIAKVSREFSKRISMEGTGRLRDGRVVTRAGRCKCKSACYSVVKSTHPWGSGVMDRQLVPFRSIAVDTRLVSIGDILYIPKLDGTPMQGNAPWGSFVHDGCVVAEDVGHGVRGKQIDLFIASRTIFRSQFRGQNHKKVKVRRGGSRCRYLAKL